jgi:hypothetical protein
MDALRALRASDASFLFSSDRLAPVCTREGVERMMRTGWVHGRDWFGRVKRSIWQENERVVGWLLR